ncbi:methyl-CpG-binding domain protein 2-like, partial [Tachysurus ichikawai]
GKPDLNTALPIRQTASIFKQPVTKVVNHPNNKVKTDLQRATEQPRQVSVLDSASADYSHVLIISCR